MDGYFAYDNRRMLLFLSWRMETEWQYLATFRQRADHYHHDKYFYKYSKLEE